MQGRQILAMVAEVGAPWRQVYPLGAKMLDLCANHHHDMEFWLWNAVC